MEIPFDTIVETKFVNAAPGAGLASFFLSQPPVFFLETVTPSPNNGPPLRSWKPCSDWTEGMQATKVLRHDLVGSAVQLAHVLRNLNVNNSAGSEIPLHPPSYRPAADISPTPTQAPILGFVEPTQDLMHPSRPEQYGYDLQRPQSGNSLHHPLTHSPRHLDDGLMNHSPSPSIVTHNGYARMSPLPSRKFSAYPEYSEHSKSYGYHPQELDISARDVSYPMTHSAPPIPRRSSYGDGPPSSSPAHSTFSSSPHGIPTPFRSPPHEYWQPSAGNHASPMLSGNLPPPTLLHAESQGSGMSFNQPVGHHLNKLP